MKTIFFALLMLAGVSASAMEIQQMGILTNGNLYLRVAHDAGCHQRSLNLKNVSCSNDLTSCTAELDVSQFVEDCTGRISAEESEEIDLSKLGLYGPKFQGTKLTITYGTNFLGFPKKQAVTLIGERAGYE